MKVEWHSKPHTEKETHTHKILFKNVIKSFNYNYIKTLSSYSKTMLPSEKQFLGNKT